jgi:hypothetical protein
LGVVKPPMVISALFEIEIAVPVTETSCPVTETNGTPAPAPAT